MRSGCVHHVVFNDPATTEFYPLSLHGALPISARGYDHAWVLDADADGSLRTAARVHHPGTGRVLEVLTDQPGVQDRKSTRLNSSHANISYAVFCSKKKNYRSSFGRRAPNRPHL